MTKVLPPQPQSARHARRFVRDCLEPYDVANDTIELVASELVGNVVTHAKTDITVQVIVGRRVRLEICDGNAVAPALKDAALDAERGRGLFIVDAVSADWGVEPLPAGKRIWVEFERRGDVAS